MVKVYIHNRFENLSCIFQVAFKTGATWTQLTVTCLLWLQERHHLLVKANTGISSHYKGLNWGTLKGFFANLIKKCFVMGEMIKSSIQFFKVVTAIKYIQI